MDEEKPCHLCTFVFLVVFSIAQALTHSQRPTLKSGLVLAGLLSLTLLAPTDTFAIRALSVQAPFARPVPRVYDLSTMASDFGAGFRHDAVQAVHREARSLTCASGAELPYDSLLVAAGRQLYPPSWRVLLVT